MRTLLAVAVGVITCGAVAPVALAADAEKVQAAVAKAAEYFKKRANGQAGPGAGAVVMHGIGETALVGLAMLEANIPPSDGAMKKVIDQVRAAALEQTQTYAVALTVLFLDRLGDPSDVPVIQMLGLRLYAGMNPNGGWGYSTWEQPPDANELVRLKKALQENQLETAPKPGGGSGGPGQAGGKLHPEVAKYANAVGQAIRARGRASVGDDNSNTQFGMIALWVACRNGLPGRDAFAVVEKRFLATQNPRDAGWAYTPDLGGAVGGSTPAMTCAGLLGLALGAGARDARLTGERKEPAKPAPKKDDDPFSNPNDPNRPKPAGKEKDDTKPPANLPKSVQAALASMGQFLQAAKAGRGGPGGPGMPGGQPGNPLGAFIGLGNSYYLLWSLERMAVAYSLDTIGGVDWHDFGANLLIPAQQQDGSWPNDSYGSDVNTAFAVLFLTKSNLVRDLSGRIKGTKDPGKSELRGSSGPALLAPPPKDPPKQGGSKPETPSPSPSPSPKPAQGGGFTLPPVVMPTEAAEAEKAAKVILEAKDEEWKAKLDEARDTKGGKWSRALALVCSKTDGEKRKQAREALADRLTRMTAGTLKNMLNDEDGELRRAACLAVAMKEEKALIPDVIDRIADASDPVGRAARAALKSLSGVDFGPAAGADDDAKLAATTAWRAWYEAQKK